MAEENKSNDSDAETGVQIESSVRQEPVDNEKLRVIDNRGAISKKKRKSNDDTDLKVLKKKGKENIDKIIPQKAIVAVDRSQFNQSAEKSPVKQSNVNSSTKTVTSSPRRLYQNHDKDSSLAILSTPQVATQHGVSEKTLTGAKSIATKKKQNGSKNESSKTKLDEKLPAQKKKKRHHSSAMKDLRKITDGLKSRIDALEEKEQERHKIVMEALQTILDNWNEHRQIPSDVNSRILEQRVGYPEPGFVRLGDNTIHLGQGMYIPKKIYDTAVFKSRTNSMFVKKILMTQFTEEELLTHSVTGATSNRVKLDEQKPALDPTKMRAIKDIFEFYLKSKDLNTNEVKEEVERCATYIRSRISDARAEQRRREKERKNPTNPKPEQTSDDAEDEEEEEGSDSSESSESKSEGEETKDGDEIDQKDDTDEEL